MQSLRSQVASLQGLVEALPKRMAEQDRILARLAAGAAPAEAGAAESAPVETPGAAAEQKTAEQIALEQDLARELGAAPGAPAASPDAAAAASSPGPIVLASGAGGKNFLNLSIDVLAAAGASTTPEIAGEGGIETGGHDPSQRGVTLQNAELVLDGAVDPYFRGQANIVLQLDDHGETNVELEEAYLTTTSLPWNFQVKAGQFFSEYGRLNSQHPHTWDFVDQPLVNGRFLGGDGLRGPGARVSWLMPTRFYSEAFLSVQNSQGETASSFRNDPGEEVFGRPIQDRPVRTAGDMLYVPRYAASFDLTDTQTLVVGASAALGPNGTSQDARTAIYGLDAFWKWKPSNSQGGFPFVKWQTEAMQRRYDAGAFSDDTDGDGTIDISLPSETLRDWGGYSQVLWGFRRGWIVGLRGDYVTGDEGAFNPDPTRLTHWRVSPNLTWFPTEFSKLRLQYNHDEVEGLGSDESLWLQVEFILGAHGAHKF
jgi:hypothetical protein